jgi:hypothetical protein
VLPLAYESDRCSSDGTSMHAPAVIARTLPSGAAGHKSTVRSAAADARQRAPAAAVALEQASARTAPKWPTTLRRMRVAFGSTATCAPRRYAPLLSAHAVPRAPTRGSMRSTMRHASGATRAIGATAPRSVSAHQRGVGAVHPHVRACSRGVHAARREPFGADCARRLAVAA